MHLHPPSVICSAALCRSLRLASAVEDGDDAESDVEQGYRVCHKATHISHFSDS
jgi:hypothetical protein